MRAISSIAVTLLLLALSACGSTTAPVAQVVALDDSQNGTTIQVHAGDVVSVSLNSTNWTFGAVSDSTVLQPQGDQAVTPAPMGTCLPGMGCGTTTARFTALKSGTAVVSATRVSCGEAMRCVGQQGLYQVTVVVS
jgi:hypothetical protein